MGVHRAAMSYALLPSHSLNLENLFDLTLFEARLIHFEIVVLLRSTPIRLLWPSLVFERRLLLLRLLEAVFLVVT